MPSCVVCGAKSPLIKVGQSYYCFSCYAKHIPSFDEVETIVREAVESDLEYIDEVYERRLM